MEFRRSATFYLLVSLAVIFLLQAALLVHGRIDLAEIFGLSRAGLFAGRIWQLITFQFLHDCPWPWHLLMNCLGLYFFGRAIEETHGTANFLKLYLLAGTLGGLAEVLASFLPQHPHGGVVGASAGVMGLIAAYATLNPWQEACFIFYFFPVRLKASVVLWFLLFLSTFGVIIPFGGTAHAAHLGGLLTGIAFARYVFLAGDDFPLARLFPTPREKSQARRFAFVGKKRMDRSARAFDPPVATEEFISREVDPILDKISAHGIQSLTERERKILEAARAKMSKR